MVLKPKKILPGICLLLMLSGSSVRLLAQYATADWDSLRQRPYPEWFSEAKLGVFIHWGVYSVPAYGGAESYGEWFLRGLQTGNALRTDFMKKNYGENFTYRDFAPLFKAELFDSDEWAEIFKQSGAGYIVLVSKHHDGYCLWPSKYAPGWNSVEVGPNRDLVGELATSVREKGLKFGLYYSLPEWDHPLHAWYSDPPDSIGKYVTQHMIPQFKELVGTYRPELLFTDGEWFNSAEQWHARELIGWYYDLVGENAIVNDRWGHGADIGFLTPEYSSGGLKTDRPWAEVRGLGRSFGLNRNEKLSAYMSSTDLIHLFIRTVANGGGLIINVGPGADGQIPLLQQERLRDLGKWININQEAIQGASAHKITGQEKQVSLNRIDPQIDFDWVRNTPGYPIVEDGFTATWTGFLKTDISEEVTFSASADDGVRVYLDGKLLLDKWETSAEENNSEAMRNVQSQKKDGKVNILTGKFYPIKIEYQEKHQNASVSLSWEGNSFERQIIPRQNLFSDSLQTTGNGLNAEYTSMRQYIAFTTNKGNLYAITFEWPEQFLELQLTVPQPETKISLIGRDGYLPWTYEENKLKIDISGVKFSEMKSCSAWTFKIENYL